MRHKLLKIKQLIIRALLKKTNPIKPTFAAAKMQYGFSFEVGFAEKPEAFL
jgi:hypothetical protein